MDTSAILQSTHPVAASGRRVARRAGAVAAGLAANFVLSTAVDAVLHATGVYPRHGQRMADALFVLAVAYRTVFSVVGCYITARLAPDRPLQHALGLGALGVVLSAAGAAAMWDQGPAWYSLGLIALAIPCAWLGGALHVFQRSRP